MSAPFKKPGCLVVLSAIAWGWPATVSTAQTTSLATVTARVPVDDVVYVTDTSGTTLEGKLANATDDAVEVKVSGDTRNVPVANILRIEWRQPDSVLSGMLIGAGIGAVPGVYWLITDPNECSGLCPEEYALIGMGAAGGALIDWLISKRVTVYEPGSTSGRSNNVIIGPLVMRNRMGVRVAMTF